MYIYVYIYDMYVWYIRMIYTYDMSYTEFAPLQLNYRRYQNFWQKKFPESKNDFKTALTDGEAVGIFTGGAAGTLSLSFPAHGVFGDVTGSGEGSITTDVLGGVTVGEKRSVVVEKCGEWGEIIPGLAAGFAGVDANRNGDDDVVERAVFVEVVVENGVLDCRDRVSEDADEGDGWREEDGWAARILVWGRERLESESAAAGGLIASSSAAEGVLPIALGFLPSFSSPDAFSVILRLIFNSIWEKE